MATIVFSHGNSFPAGTYSQFTAALKSRGYRIHSIDKFGHDARYPVTDNWPALVQQLADFVTPLVEQSGQKVYLVGHSLGGILSTMMASAHPELAAGIVLLDSPVLGGWRAKTLAAAKASGIVKSISPGKVSYRRTQVWQSAEAAYENFKSKRAFSTWTDACLRDYITYGTHEGADGKRHLTFDRKIETKIYNTLPDNLDTVLKKAPLQCPAAFIGGLQSQELKQTGTDLTEKIVQGRMHWIDGGHLFPMEKPQAVAALVDGIIQALKPSNTFSPD